MKKRIASFMTVAILLLVLQPLRLSVCAEGFSVQMLSDFGVFSYRAAAISTPCMVDGVLTSAEYPVTNTVGFQNGLRLLSTSGMWEASATATEGYAQSADVFESVSISYDDNYVYIGVAYSEAASGRISAFSHPIYGSVYIFTPEISFNSSSDPFERAASFSNSYCFSSADLKCKVCFGTRTTYASGKYQVVGKVSSYNPSAELAYVSDEGKAWDGARYLEEAVLTHHDNRFVFECRIPIGDILRSTAASKQEQVLAQLLDRTGTLCGGFDIKSVVVPYEIFSDGVEDTLHFSTSLPGSSVCSLSENEATWSEEMANRFGVANSNLLQEILAPIYWVGTPLAAESGENASASDAAQSSGDSSQNQVDATENPAGSDDENENLPHSSAASSTESAAASFAATATENKTASVTPENADDTPALSNEQDSLWQEFLEWESGAFSSGTSSDSVPLGSEIVYEEGKNSDYDSSGDQSAVSSSVLLGSGILLLSAIVGVAIIFQASEKNKNKAKKN